MFHKQKSYNYLISIFYGFIVFGFIDNIKGAILPDFLESFQMDYSQGSDILAFVFIGYMTGTLITGYIGRFFIKKHIVCLSASMMSVGILGFTTFHNSIRLKMFFFILGVGLGIIQVIGNSIIVDMFPERKGKYLNLLTFFNGLGSIIAPIIVSILLSKNHNWKSIYRYSLILPIVLLLIFIFTRKDSSDKRTGMISSSHKGMFQKNVIFLALTMCFYIASEIGMSSWLVEFLQKDKNIGMQSSSLLLSSFFFCLTFGRLAGSFLIEKVSYYKTLITVLSCAIILIILGIVLPVKFVFLLPLTGLCFSVVFPTIVAIASEQYKKETERILSIVFFAGGIGGTIGPWIIGKLSNIVNIKFGFASVIVYCISCLLMTNILLINSKKSL